MTSPTTRQPLPELMTRQEVADAFRVHRATVANWVRRGLLDVTATPGGAPRYYAAQVRELLHPDLEVVDEADPAGDPLGAYVADVARAVRHAGISVGDYGIATAAPPAGAWIEIGPGYVRSSPRLAWDAEAGWSAGWEDPHAPGEVEGRRWFGLGQAVAAPADVAEAVTRWLADPTGFPTAPPAYDPAGLGEALRPYDPRAELAQDGGAL
ncbi:DUF6292 family protein [Spirillospora sp. NBC_01491]|uniref:DUF6292 family protein n=1 Tax=Spirillospora sp. NBC_01491 TaxID=2976007 RepID=UPI002E308925|nr:DUF6292 family protein [Spirillospora sp. NBC_01491]